MELATAEEAAIRGGREISRASLEVANVEKPRDPAERWEQFVRFQYQALVRFSQESYCLISEKHLPPRLEGCRPGMEVNVFIEPTSMRVWKTTFPNLAGFGPSGYFTPGGYLRRLRLSNLIFGDDVAFEGILKSPKGPSIVTSQQFIQSHPERFVPTEEEISGFLTSLGFEQTRGTSWYRAADGVTLGDCHDRNFIRTPVASIVAIDVQPVLDDGHAFEDVIPWPSTFS